VTPRRHARGPELVDLARSVLVEEGLDRFVLRDIASRAGMTVGNLQYYFPTRDDLLTAVIRAELDRDLRTIRGVVAGTGGGLDQLAHGLVSNWCDGGSSVFTVLSLLAFHHDHFRRLNREIYETFYAELAVVVRSADPEADDAEVSTRVRVMTAVLDGVALQIHAAVTDAASCDDLLRRATTQVAAIAGGT
jgi:AcrR family transcriptional regulator